MSFSDDGNSSNPIQAPNPGTHPSENDGETDWLDVLNSFLDRALKADIDTGC